MNYISKLIVFIILIVLTSCSSKEKRHIGQWEISINDNIVGFISINEEIVNLYYYKETECDTTIEFPYEFILETEQTIGQVTKIHCNSDEGRIKIILRFNDIQTGEICFEGMDRDCGTFKKSSLDLNLLINNEDEVIYNYRNKIASEIISTKNKVETLRHDRLLLEKSINLLNYIDSFEKQLLLQYDLNYSTIKCWHKLDSLTSSRTSIIFLFGTVHRIIDTTYNAHELEKRLTNYLKTSPKKDGIKIIFPTFNGSDFLEFDYENRMVSWSYNTFYYASLGATIKELENLKLNIIQLDLINSNYK